VTSGRWPPDDERKCARGYLGAADATPAVGAYGLVMIENPRTGEQIEFDSSDPDVLVMHSRWTRPGHRAAAHVHPRMEERFEVIEGRAAFSVAGRRIDAAAGDAVIVPPSVEHLAWNPTDHVVRLRIEMRPPLRWEEFTRRLFAGESVQNLLSAFAPEIVLPGA
jgi:mannose-6-phosphate isomerase-like protein (cupin superfamily)